MIAQVKWTDADVAAAHWAYLRQNPRRFLRYFRYPIIAIAVSVTVLVQYPESWQIIGGLLVFDAGTIAYELWLFRRNTSRRFTKLNLGLGGVSVTTSDKSIQVSGPGITIERNWAEIAQIVEYKRVFFFSRADKKVSFLPKSGMSESQLEELRVCIATYAKGKVKLAGSR